VREDAQLHAPRSRDPALEDRHSKPINNSFLFRCLSAAAPLPHVKGRPGSPTALQQAFYQLLPHVVTFMAVGKFRRAGYVFITWKGDHPPRHVHVYLDGKLMVKWDLDNQKPMKGTATRRILKLIAELESEGLL
jgi:hypothetical protein